MMKIEGSGSESGFISQRHGSADQDPHPTLHIRNIIKPSSLALVGCGSGSDFGKVSDPNLD
jgi:hypothetical protein